MSSHITSDTIHIQSLLCARVGCGEYFMPVRGRSFYCSNRCGMLGRPSVVGHRQSANKEWTFKCGHVVVLPEIGESNELVSWKKHKILIKQGYWICRVCYLASTRARHLDTYSRLKKLILNSKGAARLRGHVPIVDSVERILEIWQSQNGLCKSCTRPVSLFGKHSHIDHCHKTGAVRGVVCSHCNWIEGHLHHYSIEQFNSLVSFVTSCGAFKDAN